MNGWLVGYKRPRSGKVVWVYASHADERDAAIAADQAIADGVLRGAPRLRGRGTWNRYAGPLPATSAPPMRCLVAVVRPVF